MKNTVNVTCIQFQTLFSLCYQLNCLFVCCCFFFFFFFFFFWGGGGAGGGLKLKKKRLSE